MTLGAIENGESPSQALRREIAEELGIVLKLSNASLFLERNYRVSAGFKGREYIFKALFNLPISNIRLSEGAGFALFTERELLKLKIAPLNRLPIKKFFKEY